MTSGPGLCAGEKAFEALRRGSKLLADLVRPTLGPVPRTVAIARPYADRAPEILDDAATIARRMVQLPDPYADMGAMLLRHTLWQVERRAGDGGARTAVMLQAIVEAAAPYLAAGGDARALVRGLERGLAASLAALEAQTRPLEGPEAISQAAAVQGDDPELAQLLGEILDIVGPEGWVQVERGHTLRLEHHYVEGAHWYTGYVSPYFVSDPVRQEARLEQPRVLISDLRLTRATELLPLLERLAQAGQHRLLIIAQQIADEALALLLTNHRAGALQLLAVKAPGHGAQQAGILEDLAVLTGGQVVSRLSGARPERITLEQLGQARSAWANAGAFGLLGGSGDPMKLRQHIGRLRVELAATQTAQEREQLRQRLGRLLGGVAILQVGAATTSALELRMARAERGVTALRLALSAGVAPGAGSAYLACQQGLQQLPAPPEEALGLRILARALEEPLRVIAHNAGADPALTVERVRSSPDGWGFDARCGSVVDTWAAGLLDPLPVLQLALQAAVSGACMLLSTAVLVHRQRPKISFEP